MRRLSSPLTRMRAHYPVVVVGSGYGGAIAASRMARAGQKVCLLERGRELLPGEYPRTPQEALDETQLHGAGRQVGSSTGLYMLHANEDISVFAGCGLGGTSLINANVALPPDPRVFEDTRWPAALREDVDGLLAEGFVQAGRMLRSTPYPENLPVPPKLRVLEDSARALGGRFYRPPLNISFQGGVNPVGVEQKACDLCGDCLSGCNRGSKNTLLMNYLPDAHRHGADIFTEVAVRYVARAGRQWRVYFRPAGTGRERFDGPDLFVLADHVVLAAGTLGTNEILLRSREHGLSTSDRLGRGFSGNGDVLAFSYNQDTAVNGVGAGALTSEDVGAVGPCITGIIDQRDTERLEDGQVIEDGAIPGFFSPLALPILGTMRMMKGKETAPGPRGWLAGAVRTLDSAVRGSYRGAVHNTQTYLAMSHDDGDGVLRLEGDRLRIDWEGVGRQSVFERVHGALEQAAARFGGTYVPNPLTPGQGLMSVHPLGGCAMAEDASRGVVDHEGRVFRGPSGTAVHEGLYVSDGSVMSRPLGVNPLLTICALAERSCALMARRHGWRIDYGLPPVEPLPSTPRRLGFQFTETMHGHCSDARGVASPLRFVLTAVAEDLEALLERPEHAARLVGTVTAPALSSRPLMATQGVLHLLVNHPGDPSRQLMRYTLPLTSEEGERYWLEGLKEVRTGFSLGLWRYTTTLSITLRKGEGPEAPLLGRGVLRLTPADFAQQLATLKVLHARDHGERAVALARFGRFFLGSLLDSSGGATSLAAAR